MQYNPELKINCVKKKRGEEREREGVLILEKGFAILRLSW